MSDWIDDDRGDSAPRAITWDFTPEDFWPLADSLRVVLVDYCISEDGARRLIAGYGRDVSRLDIPATTAAYVAMIGRCLVDEYPDATVRAQVLPDAGEHSALVLTTADGIAHAGSNDALAPDALYLVERIWRSGTLDRPKATTGADEARRDEARRASVDAIEAARVDVEDWTAMLVQSVPAASPLHGVAVFDMHSTREAITRYLELIDEHGRLYGAR